MLDTDKIIKINDYRGILAQDGWETLELTVRDNHTRVIANNIIQRLKDTEV